jgi:hypothetical protein
MQHYPTTEADNEEKINEDTLQGEGRQLNYSSPILPDLNDAEPMLNNLTALRLDRIEVTIKQCSNKNTLQYNTHCTEQIRELKKNAKAHSPTKLQP